MSFRVIDVTPICDQTECQIEFHLAQADLRSGFLIFYVGLHGMVRIKWSAPSNLQVRLQELSALLHMLCTFHEAFLSHLYTESPDLIVLLYII